MRRISSPLWLGRFDTMEEARAAFRARGHTIAQELRFPHVDPTLVRFLSPDSSITAVADVRELLATGKPEQDGGAKPGH